MAEDRNAVALFVTMLGVPMSVAISLVRAGITTLEEVAYVPVDELLEVPGVTPEVLQQLREKARAYLAL